MKMQRCNHCMVIFDEQQQVCPNCWHEDALMYPFEDDADSDFDVWWRDEGSGIVPLPEHDMAQHAERVARIAWSNGAYKQQYSAYRKPCNTAMLCLRCGRPHRLRDEDAGSDREALRLCAECFNKKGV